MNTLVLLTDLEHAVGGIAAFNRLLVRALADPAVSLDRSLTVLSLNDPATPPRRLEGVPGVRYAGFGRQRIRFAGAAWEAAQSAGRVFFGHSHLTPLRWLMPDSRKIAIAHGIDVWRPLKPMQRLALRGMDDVWAVSDYTARELVSVQGVDPSRCAVLPNSLPEPAPKALVARNDLALPAGRILLSVSRLNSDERYKQIELVLDVLPLLLPRAPDVFYVVVGDGSDRARLAARARDLNVDDHVLFPGNVPDERLPSYYEACDVFVLPSLAEGFGIVFLEAMSHGKPCVGAKAGGVPEVIQDGVTGLLAEPADARSLRSAIDRLLSEPELRHQLGEAGRQRVESEFSFHRFRERLRRLLFVENTGRLWRAAA